MSRTIICLLSKYFSANISLCLFSITKTISAQSINDWLILMRALGEVPAERAAWTGLFLKIAAPVGLRHWFIPHTNKIFIMSYYITFIKETSFSLQYYQSPMPILASIFIISNSRNPSSNFNFYDAAKMVKPLSFYYICPPRTYIG